jgi:1L-myo-inositol 1-phosphate cytidylyltransferase
MIAISEAVILIAGSGSRLRGSDPTFLKPFVPVLGRPLLCYVMDVLVHARIRNVNFVVGYESERVTAQVRRLVPSEFEPCFIENHEWKKQNGISLLAVAKRVTRPFLLAMSDHLFDSAIVDLLISSADPSFLNVAVDRKLRSIFDLNDAMKVQTRGNQVIAIGKNLRDYDAIDTGLFVSPPEIFRYLEKAKQNGDCSLADGIRLMAAADKVRVIDIGDAWWQDVDTPEMLACAQQHLQTRTGRSDPEAFSASGATERREPMPGSRL